MTNEPYWDLQPRKRSTSRRAAQPVTKPEGEGSKLRGLRCLIVEDEFLVGLLLEDDLKERGSVIVATCRTLDEASKTAAKEQFDLAILDINLNGEMVFPLADTLITRGKPLIFLSGYVANLPERFRDLEAIAKPYHVNELENAITRALKRSAT